MLDLLSQSYFVHALAAGTVVGATCSLVGVYVLLRRIVFLGIALAQVASAAVALALLVGWNPLVTALVASVGGAAALSQVRWAARLPSEGVIGAAYVVAAALATTFVALNPVGEARALSVLFGNILSVPRGELLPLAVVAAVVIVAHVVLRPRFVFVSFDAETAAAHGLRVRLWDLALYVSLGLAIAFAIRSAGVLVTFALLVVPATGARLLARRVETMLVAAVVLGTLSVPLGLVAAFVLDLPTGATICLAVALGAALAVGVVRIRVARGTAAAAALAATMLAAATGAEAQAGGTDVERELRALREAVTDLRNLVTEQQRIIDELRAGRGGGPGTPGARLETTAPPPPAPRPPSMPPTEPERPGPPDTGRGLPPWLALLPEWRVEGNLIGNYTLRNRRNLERALGEERDGEEFFVRRDRLNVREVELGLRSTIDPFARFEAILSAEQRFGGELEVGLEEAILTFGALPGGFELRAGRLRTGFGEFNESDPEEFPEVTPPLVIRNVFGSEGWIDTGLTLSRRFGLTDSLSVMLWGAVWNGDNEQAFHGGGAAVARRPAWFGRAEAFLELGDAAGLELGLGFAEGRALGEDRRATLRSRILNAHVELDYRHPVLGLYRGFNFLTEVFSTWRDRFREPSEEEEDAGEGRRRETIGRVGLYSLGEVLLGRRWSLGGRFDYSELPEREEDGPSIRRETAGSLILSYRPSRFLTLRGQYTRTGRNFTFDSDEIYLQALFTLGYERPGPF